jgi:hypothetical protein
VAIVTTVTRWIFRKAVDQMNKPRLVDANELKKKIEDVCGGQTEILIQLVDNIPTAYDIDKITEMEDYIKELEVITGLMRKRTYYRKFLDEVWQKQEGKELSEPDFDYIYKLYFEMIEQRNKVVEQLDECANEEIHLWASDEDDYDKDGNLIVRKITDMHMYGAECFDRAIEIVKGGTDGK